MEFMNQLGERATRTSDKHLMGGWDVLYTRMTRKGIFHHPSTTSKQHQRSTIHTEHTYTMRPTAFLLKRSTWKGNVPSKSATDPELTTRTILHSIPLTSFITQKQYPNLHEIKSMYSRTKLCRIEIYGS